MEKLYQSFIYKFTNKINNKVYIGSTIQPIQKRYKQHLYNVNHKTDKYDYPLYAAIRKYGIENFNFEIIENRLCIEEEIRKIQHDYILKYNCIAPNGYNQTQDTNHPLNDPNTYKKIKQTKREKAKSVAEINRQKNIINIWDSIIDCAEKNNLSQKHIADCCRGQRHSTGGRYFVWVDENGELQIPDYHISTYKGQKGTTQKQKTNKKVAKIDLISHEILNTYDSIALASRQNNCDSSGITKVCKGTRKKCGGFYWKYIDN